MRVKDNDNYKKYIVMKGDKYINSSNGYCNEKKESQITRKTNYAFEAKKSFKINNLVNIQ